MRAPVLRLPVLVHKKRASRRVAVAAAAHLDRLVGRI